MRRTSSEIGVPPTILMGNFLTSFDTEDVQTSASFVPFIDVVFSMDRTPNKGKLESKSKKRIFMGYSKKSKRYLAWIQSKRKMIILRDVKFLKEISLRNNNVPEDFFHNKQ